MSRRRKGGMLKRQSRAEGSRLAGGSCSTGTLLEGMQAAVTHCLPLPCLGQWLPAPSRPAAGTCPDCQNNPKPFAPSRPPRYEHKETPVLSTDLSAVPPKHIPSQTPILGTHCRIWQPVPVAVLQHSRPAHAASTQAAPCQGLSAGTAARQLPQHPEVLPPHLPLTHNWLSSALSEC